MIVSDSDRLNGELVTLSIVKPSSITVCHFLLPQVSCHISHRHSRMPRRELHLNHLSYVVMMLTHLSRALCTSEGIAQPAKNSCMLIMPSC